jgi:hypothetical protein
VPRTDELAAGLVTALAFAGRVDFRQARSSSQ